MDKKLKEIPTAELRSILQKYKNSLVVYEKKPVRKFFLCPVGLVGAGKTTVLKPLAEQMQTVRVSTDEIRRILKNKGYNYDFVGEIALKLIEDFAKEGYSVAIDADCVNKKDNIEKLAKEAGAKIIWLHINPPEEFIINKLRNFKNGWLVEDNEEMVRNYFERKSLHQKLDFPFLYVFDTSKNNLKEQIKEAEDLIKGELKI
ncbi:MAG TPA: AAA family ATPase [Candidatus Portnoybacteria bacterium]|nr:AAA family ATPase [Candidatus Portnoybacteria bacterium]